MLLFGFGYVLLCFWFDFLSAVSGSITCYDGYSCASSNISTSSSNDDIECYGYFSCSNAGLIESIGSSTEILCAGSYSCYQAKLIISNHSSSTASNILCIGLYSCANVGLIYNTLSNTNCIGEQACSNANIVGSYSSKYMTCHGLLACSNATVTNYMTHYVSGYLGAFNTVFKSIEYTGGSTDIFYGFYGSQSGKNATIICGSDNDCDIECYDTGCNELNLMCVDSSTLEVQGYGLSECDNFYVTCGLSQNNDICPYAHSYTNTIPDLYDGNEYYNNVTFSNEYNSFNICNSDSNGISYNCINTQGCTNSNFSNLFSNMNVTLCCSAYESCYGVDNIKTSLINSDRNVAIRCDGEDACLGISGMILASGINTAGGNNNIYFSAGRTTSSTDGVATISAISSIAGNSSNNNNTKYDIYCNGVRSCNYQYITHVKNVFCLSYFSCYYVTIDGNVNNVFMYSDVSGRYATISNISGNVYCAPKESCRQSTISNIQDSLHARGYYALGQSQISNVSNVS